MILKEYTGTIPAEGELAEFHEGTRKVYAVDREKFIEFMIAIGRFVSERIADPYRIIWEYYRTPAIQVFVGNFRKRKMHGIIMPVVPGKLYVWGRHKSRNTRISRQTAFLAVFGNNLQYLHNPDKERQVTAIKYSIIPIVCNSYGGWCEGFDDNKSDTAVIKDNSGDDQSMFQFWKPNQWTFNEYLLNPNYPTLRTIFSKGEFMGINDTHFIGRICYVEGKFKNTSNYSSNAIKFYKTITQTKARCSCSCEKMIF